MVTIVNNELWKTLIDKYKSLPVLWKVKSDNYKNKTARSKAWEELLGEFKNIEPNATVASLKQKLNNMRTCYRRELKKKEASEKSGAEGEDIYEPSLWYFDELEFLRDQETQIPGTSTVNIDEDVIEKEHKKPRNTQTTKDDYLGAAVKHLQEIREGRRGNEKDDAAIYADSWAVSFRKLTSMQQIYAKKAIEDILILGQLGQLSLDCVRSSPPISRMSTPASTNPLSPISIPPNVVFVQPSSSNHGGNVEYLNLTELVQDTQFH